MTVEAVQSSIIVGIEVGTLRHDPTVQRPLDPVQVRRMVETFDEHALGTVAVSRRKDRGLYVIDGNHRCHVVRELAGGHATIRCEVFDGLTLAQEARLSRTLNDRRNWKYFDSFRLDVIAGDPVAVAVSTLVPSTGWEINASPGRGHLGAIKSAVDVYLGVGVTGVAGPHPDALVATLNVLGETFGYDGTAVSLIPLRGLGAVYVRSMTEIDPVAMIKAMQRKWGSPEALIGDAKGFASYVSTSKANACAEIIVNVYNQKRTVHRLAEWRTK